MKRIFEYIIQPDEASHTIGEYLKTKGYSRHIVTHVKYTENGICLNQKQAFTNQVLSAGDCLCITLLEEESSEQIKPVPLPISIVYEDEDLMVINKAADTPIHPSINNYENTLANGVCWYFQQQGIPFVYRCINRLDRDTTGLLIIAKHMLSAAILSQMVVKREIHREYLAIALGEVPEHGTIDAPIARHDASAIERCVDFSKGERAVTHYQRVMSTGDYSLVRLKLETGRTHQIRVHMNYLGHSLVGDFLYHPTKETDLLTQKRMQRQALHSHRLTFIHPITGETLDFVSPLPADMDWIEHS